MYFNARMDRLVSEVNWANWSMNWGVFIWPVTSLSWLWWNRNFSIFKPLFLANPPMSLTNSDLLEKYCKFGANSAQLSWRYSPGPSVLRANRVKSRMWRQTPPMRSKLAFENLSNRRLRLESWRTSSKWSKCISIWSLSMSSFNSRKWGCRDKNLKNVVGCIGNWEIWIKKNKLEIE